MNSSSDPDLYWDSTYAIALSLMKYYPDAHPDDVGLVELATMVENLPNFKDEPALANQGLLQEIQFEWYEEITHI